MNGVAVCGAICISGQFAFPPTLIGLFSPFSKLVKERGSPAARMLQQELSAEGELVDGGVGVHLQHLMAEESVVLLG